MKKYAVLDCAILTKNMQDLVTTDSLFAPVFNGSLPNRTWERTACTFESFVDTVVSQQLSIKAAATIFGRVEHLLGHISPETMRGVSDEALRGCGLSFQKIKYLRGLADQVQAGHFSPEKLHSLPDDQVLSAVTALHGFGVWSAQMLLIFNLARPDIFPPGDLGVLEGLRKIRRLKIRPTAKPAEAYAARKWRGKRTAATLLLWEANKLL